MLAIRQYYLVGWIDLHNRLVFLLKFIMCIIKQSFITLFHYKHIRYKFLMMHEEEKDKVQLTKIRE